MNKIAIWASISTMLMIPLSCQNDSSSSPSPSNGSQVSTQGIVTIRITREIATRIGSGRFADEPEAGKVFVVVDLEISNNGCPNFSVNPFRFNLIADNVSYSPAFVTQLENKLDAVDVRDGGTTSGKLTFEVPEDFSEFAMSCDSRYGENCRIEWQNH